MADAGKIVRLMESLNPLTTYCIPGAGRVLPDPSLMEAMLCRIRDRMRAFDWI
jgi:hypothetical protein